MKKVVIVGSGLGGLATALRLVKRGFEVTILEKNDKAGGRLNQIQHNGFIFDTGPSFFSMSYEFMEFAKDCSIELPFEYYELDPLYAVNFAGSEKFFLLYKDIKKLTEQFSDIELDFYKKMQKYLGYCKKIYEDTVDVVVKRNFDNLFDYLAALIQVNPQHLPLLFKNFWQQVASYFESDTVRQIISLVAFFLGRTPFDTMAIYTLLSHVEFVHDGYYNVKGGMYKIVEGLVDLLNKSNVQIHYNTEIVDYESKNNSLTVLIDSQGNKWDADIFVINADAAVFRNSVFKRPNFSDSKMNKKIWTMGYLTIYVGLNTKLENVFHHNYFLGNNYKIYAKNVMTNPGTLEKPYYYVNVISKHNPELAPVGCESVFFVCPVPNLSYKNDWSDAEEIVNSILVDFSQRIGKDITKNIIVKKYFTPKDWKEKFNLWQGSGLGLAHTMNQIGYLRPKNIDEVFKNTFYVGASTVPGAGLPMSIISSKLVVQQIERKL